MCHLIILLVCQIIPRGLRKDLMILVNLQKIFQESFNEWMEQSTDTSTIKMSSGNVISHELLTHSEILLLRYHQALKKELEKQGFHI